jgi:hypothetical protein
VFVRASTRRNSAGVPVRYLQLVHNVWDPASRTSRAQVLHSFGREDQLDRAAIERLITSLRRLLDPAAALGAPAPAAEAGEPGAGLTFVSSRALGATWALDGVWHALGLNTLLRRLLAEGRRGERVERMLFGLVAARAIEPASKLATAAWLSRRTHIADLTDDATVTVDGADERAGVGDDECYRAMDWLIGGRIRGGAGDLLVAAHPARPRGRPAVFRYDIDLLGDRARRCAGDPRRAWPPAARGR